MTKLMKQLDFYFEVDIHFDFNFLLLSPKFSEFICPWGVNYPWGGK